MSGSQVAGAGFVKRTHCAVGLIAMLVLVLSITSPLAGQSERTTDLQFHKFQPPVAPEEIAGADANQGKPTAGISAAAAQQMQALQQDKAQRTPAQRKIDSNILYTMRMLRGQPAAPGIRYLDTGVELDQQNDVVVDIVANVTDQLLQQVTAAGGQVLYTNRKLRSIRAIIPPGQIESIASSPDVIFIWPKQEAMTRRIGPLSQRDPLLRWKMGQSFEERAAQVRRQLAAVLSTAGTPQIGQGSVETEGDITHRALGARGAFGVNGASLKIGVLSDGVSNLALSQAMGDLPPTCGTPPCVTVLSGQAGSGDEGTAMMEIIHDMAPGASLYFATAFTSISSFAQNIHDLRTAGCDIIVDDVFYYVENPFQDGQTSAVVSNSNGGLVTQAVNDAVAAGALYFSSAGNEGSLDAGTSGTYEGDFNGVAAGAPLPAGKVHNFGTTEYDTITAPGLQVAGLWWADPLGGSGNDYDLYVLNSTGTTVLSASTNIQSGTQDALELIGSANVMNGNRLVVFQNTGAADRFFHLALFRGTLEVGTAGETHGHSAASGAYTVGATPAAEAFTTGYPTGPFPDPFNSSNEMELFSSDGLRRIFFYGDSTAITPGNFSSTGGQVLDKPDITAADGVSVTGVGGFGTPFYGTSASAPAAAAIAALVMTAQPSLTASQIRTVLTSTAVNIMASGFDRDSGHGIVMAWEAVNSLGVPGYANPELGTIAAVENPGDGNGVIEAGEGARLTIQLKNTSGVHAATGISAVLTTSTPHVFIPQPNSSAYADMAAGASGGNNLTPFTFTFEPDLPCGQTVDFALTVTYTGGPQRVLNFSLPSGKLALSNNLGTTPTPVAGVATATGTQTNRINRNGVVSACGAPKSFPGSIASGARTFDSYTFTACQAMCMEVELSSNSLNLFESVYSPSYDPTDIATNYQGDPGLSSNSQSFGIDTAAATPYVVVVNDVDGTGIGTSYTLQIPACALNCNLNHLPVAEAHDVTAIATHPGGSASANVDNGSSDPDGNEITLTQIPPGPYPLGATSVLLTVVDTKGATAQATATVTVVNPDFGISATHRFVTVTAGESATQHITFTPNPGISASLTLTCSGLPSKSACSFAPSTLPAGSAQRDVVLTISTTAPTSAALSHSRPIHAAWFPLAGMGLVAMIVMGVPRRRRRVAGVLIVVVAASFLTLLAGCGNGHHTNPVVQPSEAGTTKGTFTVTVTGASDTVRHSTTFNLTVN